MAAPPNSIRWATPVPAATITKRLPPDVATAKVTSEPTATPAAFSRICTPFCHGSRYGSFNGAASSGIARMRSVANPIEKSPNPERMNAFRAVSSIAANPSPLTGQRLLRTALSRASSSVSPAILRPAHALSRTSYTPSSTSRRRGLTNWVLCPRPGGATLRKRVS